MHPRSAKVRVDLVEGSANVWRAERMYWGEGPWKVLQQFLVCGSGSH